MADVWSGRIESVTRLGDDLRVDLVPAGAGPAGGSQSIEEVHA
jgi:hypothetical protein